MYKIETIKRIRRGIATGCPITKEQIKMLKDLGIYPEDNILEGKSWLIQRKIHGVICQIANRKRATAERFGGRLTIA